MQHPASKKSVMPEVLPWERLLIRSWSNHNRYSAKAFKPFMCRRHINPHKHSLSHTHTHTHTHMYVYTSSKPLQCNLASSSTLLVTSSTLKLEPMLDTTCVSVRLRLGICIYVVCVRLCAFACSYACMFVFVCVCVCACVCVHAH